MNNLIQYVRNKHREPVGVVVATRLSDSHVGIGWSQVHVSAGDTWDRKRGIEIAIKRAEAGVGPNVTVPHNITPIIDSMQKRAKAYFKVPTVLPA